MADAMTSLNELVRRLLTAAMGYTDTNFFRPSGQRAPAGAFKDPYATVMLYASELLGYNLRRLEVDDPVALVLTRGTTIVSDLVEVIDSLDQVTASVQFWRDGAVDGAGRAFWGEGAHDRAAKLVKRLELSTVAELANRYGLGYLGASQVRDLSAVVDGSFERRAQVDLTFCFSSPEIAALNMFRVATFDIKIQQPDGSINEVNS